MANNIKEVRNIIGVLVNPVEGAGIVTFEDTLDAMYDLINCDTIDIATRKVGGKYFDFIVDDEGLFVPDNKPSAVRISPDGLHMNPELVGNLLIVNSDAEGRTTSLTADDLVLLETHLRHVGVTVEMTGEHLELTVIELDDEQ